MQTTQKRCLLGLELLEKRLPQSTMVGLYPTTSSARHESPETAAHTIPPGNTLSILEGFVTAYPSVKGQPKYNPVYDLNHNGQIGQSDGRILLHSLPPLSPKIPITINVALAPADRVRGPVPTNLGGDTFSKNPVIVGHTTPGALIFTGTGTLDEKLRGPAFVANGQGEFALQIEVSSGLTELAFQAVDAYGQQTNLSFPILWLGFSEYEKTHPVND